MPENGLSPRGETPEPDFAPYQSADVDFSFDPPASDFLTLADQIDPLFVDCQARIRRADLRQNQVARMHKFLRPYRTIEIFESVAQAEEWLGL